MGHVAVVEATAASGQGIGPPRRGGPVGAHDTGPLTLCAAPDHRGELRSTMRKVLGSSVPRIGGWIERPSPGAQNLPCCAAAPVGRLTLRIRAIAPDASRPRPDVYAVPRSAAVKLRRTVPAGARIRCRQCGPARARWAGWIPTNSTRQAVLIARC